MNEHFWQSWNVLSSSGIKYPLSQIGRVRLLASFVFVSSFLIFSFPMSAKKTIIKMTTIKIKTIDIELLSFYFF